jgi:DNA-binding NarL/FixJ family response regulator
MNLPLRLIIADDHELFRQGLKALLLRHRDVQVVAEAESVDVLIEQAGRIPCDILLLDLQMDRSAIDEIGRLATFAHVLVLTASESAATALTAMRLGARAIVQKRYAVQTLMTAIRTVAEGLVWMPPSLQSEMAGHRRKVSSDALDSLTKRELEIVRGVASGLRNAELAKHLAISENTVKTHLTNIFHKLALRDRLELALYAIQNGLGTGTSFRSRTMLPLS